MYYEQSFSQLSSFAKCTWYPSFGKIIVIVFLLLNSASAQEVEGFVEVRAQSYVGIDSDLPVFLVERTRPTFSSRLNSKMVLNATIEAGLGQGWTPQDAMVDLLESENISPQVLSMLNQQDYTNSTLGISAAHDYLSVDRLFVEFQLESMDIKLGRQALNWGSGFIVNPSDPFPEVLLTQPWKPRSGLNALRVDIPIGMLHGAQLVVGSDDAFVHPRIAGRVTANFLETDWSLVGAWREEIGESIIGVDIKGTLGVGFWLEGVYHIVEDDSYPELVAGIDYSFPVLDSLILTAQYYRNESGESATTPSVFESRESFAPFFTGKHYLMGSASVGYNPELSSMVLWIHNIEDGSAFVVPSFTAYVNDRIELSLSGQVPIATSAGGEFKPSADDLELELPTADGSVTTLNLEGLVPESTIILWSRFNY